MSETQSKNAFGEQLFHLEDTDVKKLPTIVVWMFRSKTEPSDIRYFIKNNLFSSNYREKIRDMLSRYDFIEERDTGIALTLDDTQTPDFASLIAIHAETKKLRERYRNLV